MSGRSRSFLAAVSAPLGLALGTTLAEFRVGPAIRRVDGRWSRIRVRPRGRTKLGLSFRPRQAEDLGLTPQDALAELLEYPFEVVRLAGYWDRIERPNAPLDTSELDWQIEAAERAGKQIIVCLGPVKSFGYPEYFVPAHRLDAPLPEGQLIDPTTHPELLSAAAEQLTFLVGRYRDRDAIRAWQIEHDAVDPLGVEHSWRLATSFVRREIAAVRDADPTRPVLLNGFLPTSTPVLVHQWWRTRDQGDSLNVAQELADIVGVDFYPRHAVVGVGPWSVYLDGAAGVLPTLRRRRLLCWAERNGNELVLAEGQAEPWEAVTTPPSPARGVAASCPPERVIENYNACMQWSADAGVSTYLFWGAEYWLLRQQQGDDSYLRAFARVLEESATG